MKRAEQRNDENLGRGTLLQANKKGPSTFRTVQSSNSGLKAQKTNQCSSRKRQDLAMQRNSGDTWDEGNDFGEGLSKKDSLSSVKPKPMKIDRQSEGKLAYKNNTAGKGSNGNTSLRFQEKSNVRLQNLTVAQMQKLENQSPRSNTKFENGIENMDWRLHFNKSFNEVLPMKDFLPDVRAKKKKPTGESEGILTYQNTTAGKGFNTNKSLCFQKSSVRLQNQTCNEIRNSDNKFPAYQNRFINDIENMDWNTRFKKTFSEGLSKKDSLPKVMTKAKKTAGQSEAILTPGNNSNYKSNNTSVHFQRKSGTQLQNQADDELRSAASEIPVHLTLFGDGVESVNPKLRSKDLQHCYYAYKGFEVIPLQCEICDVTVNEVEPLFAHFNCSKHKKNMNNPQIRKHINFDEYSRRLDLMNKILDMRKKEIYECYPCSLMFRKRDDYKTHKKSKIHVEKLFKSCYTVNVPNGEKISNMHLDFNFRL